MVDKIRFLIVIADDFGIHPAVNQAIEKGFQKNVISGASLMATSDYFQEAVEITQKNKIDIGVHLSLTHETPVTTPSQVPSLVNSDGKMLDHFPQFLTRYLSRRISLDEIKLELRNQCEKVASTGLTVNHLNSHEHLHMLPGIFNYVLELCNEFNISYIRSVNEILLPGWWRTSLVSLLGVKALSWWNRKKLSGYPMTTNDYFGGILWQQLQTSKANNCFFEQPPESLTEFGVHVATKDLSGDLGYSRSRDFTGMLDWLCSKQFQRELGTSNVQLTSIQNYLRKQTCEDTYS